MTQSFCYFVLFRGCAGKTRWPSELGLFVLYLYKAYFLYFVFCVLAMGASHCVHVTLYFTMNGVYICCIHVTLYVTMNGNYSLCTCYVICYNEWGYSLCTCYVVFQSEWELFTVYMLCCILHWMRPIRYSLRKY